ncbi:hypothetical protein LIER_24919 [Lithospermum erythrorhizon]|uniref:Retrotransposon Copia-like N-terminal domain-containing protein n=1 Tax=Lithospermum erythrorhizon TaxID=34254 RepID=A0AAV3R6K1_LITER
MTNTVRNQNDNIDSIVTHHFDNPGIAIVTVLLHENNYAISSRAVKIALGAKEKLGIIDGRMISPGINSNNYDKWKKSDYMVCSWILNFISSHLREQFMFVENAKVLWDKLYQRYAMCNGLMIYQLEREISSLSQGSLSVVAYFSKLKRLWDELNVVEPLPSCNCTEGCGCTSAVEAANRKERHKLM